MTGELEAMRALGLSAQPIAPAIESIEHDDWRAHNPIGAIRRSVRTLCSRARLDAVDLQKGIAAERPDALLVDAASWGALAAAEAWGGPWACFCPFPLPLPSRQAPPYGLGLPPASGPLGRLRDRLLHPALDGIFTHLAGDPVNEVRVRLDLPPLRRVEEMLMNPPLLLYMTAEPFEYPRSDWPGNLLMIGPCAWDPPATLPPELAEIDAPLVLVTTSSEFQDDGRLVKVAVEALAEEPFHVVATLPSARLGDVAVPTNATVLPFAPHAPLLARSLCAITHGGMGATQKALASGVPVCAVPFGRDQFEVARRVEVASAGTRLPGWRLQPDRLRDKVREAIGLHAGAKRLAAAFAASGGAGAAAIALEKRLSGQ